MKEKKKLYVVSGDSDFHEVCKINSSLIYLESVENLLDIYNSHEALSTFVHRLVKTHSEIIKDEIWQQIEQATFRVKNNAGDIQSISVEKVTINALSLIDLKETEATFQVKGRAHVVARVSVENAYSYFEQIYGQIPQNQDQKTVRNWLDYKTFMAFAFERGVENKFEVLSLDIENATFLIPDQWNEEQN